MSNVENVKTMPTLQSITSNKNFNITSI